MNGDTLDDVRAEARRAEILAGLSGRGVLARSVAPAGPAVASSAPVKSRDTVQLTIKSQQHFLWKDLIGKLDDEQLGFVGELVELEASRRGLRR